MILFPNAKINLGLQVLGKRPDGYHNLATIMVPVPWCDILELIAAEDREEGIRLHMEKEIDGCDAENNLVVKALRALERHIGRALPALDVYLKKQIPFGAGLGGGSADASFAIRGANELFGLGLSDAKMAEVALTVGADCPFFIYNRPMMAEGVGEILSPVELPALSGKSIVIAKPSSEAVSTREAYAGVRPRPLAEGENVCAETTKPICEWQSSAVLANDFEQSVFPLRPEIADVKRRMLEAGALYASMSGSGASVYGIFDNDILADSAVGLFAGCETFRYRHP